MEGNLVFYSVSSVSQRRSLFISFAGTNRNSSVCIWSGSFNPQSRSRSLNVRVVIFPPDRPGSYLQEFCLCGWLSPLHPVLTGDCNTNFILFHIQESYCNWWPFEVHFKLRNCRFGGRGRIPKGLKTVKEHHLKCKLYLVLGNDSGNYYQHPRMAKSGKKRDTFLFSITAVTGLGFFTPLSFYEAFFQSGVLLLYANRPLSSSVPACTEQPAAPRR